MWVEEQYLKLKRRILSGRGEFRMEKEDLRFKGNKTKGI